MKIEEVFPRTRTLRKWNPVLRCYEPYQIPSGWYVSTYEHNMDRIVNCAHCGKELKYGDTFCSRQIHTHMGMGYGVCEECYQKEWDEEREAYVE